MQINDGVYTDSEYPKFTSASENKDEYNFSSEVANLIQYAPKDIDTALSEARAEYDKKAMGDRRGTTP